MKQLSRPCARSSGALGATLLAGAALSGIETLYAFAVRWEHSPGYFLTCFVLTLLFSALVALVGGAARLHASLVLALWAGAAGVLVIGAWEGLGVALVAILVAGLVERLRESGALLGVLAAGGFASARFYGVHLCANLELDGAVPDLLEGPLGASLVFGAVYGAAGTALVALVRGRLAVLRTPLALAATLGCALIPLKDLPPGNRRIPEPGYAQSAPRRSGERPANVFIIVLDTVRADHLSLYGYERDTTPNLRRRVESREGAAVFPRAFSNGTWTVPSHASLLTGLLPNEHGAHFALDGSLRYEFAIREEAPRLAEALKERGGYATLGVFANEWLRIVAGMGRGFDRWTRAHHETELPFIGETLRALLVPGLHMEAVKGGARANRVLDTLVWMLESWSKGPNPLFVVTNVGDAHGPYAPEPGFLGRFQAAGLRAQPGHLALDQSEERRSELMARYDEEILYLDSELERFFAGLERLGLYDSSWIVVTSDHGEAFAEHGVTEHGTAVYDEIVHIPLVVLPPAGASMPVSAGPVSLIDITKTVAGIAGVELGGPGRDLRAEASAEGEAKIEFYGDLRKALEHGAIASEPQRAVIRGTWKLVERLDRQELYDLSIDPGETKDLAAEHPEIVVELASLLPPFGTATKIERPLAPSEQKALGHTGYVEGD